MSKRPSRVRGRGTAGGRAPRSTVAASKTVPAGDSIAELTREAVAFRDARDWRQFHNFKDLAVTLTLEATEVLEHTQWKSGEELANYLAAHAEDVSDELADVLHVVLLLGEHLDVDLAAAFRRKMLKNADKYPVAKARGTHRKYTHL